MGFVFPCWRSREDSNLRPPPYSLSVLIRHVVSQALGLIQLSYGICVPVLAFPARFELATPALEGRCSIQLSYGNTMWCRVKDLNLQKLVSKTSAYANSANPTLAQYIIVKIVSQIMISVEKIFENYYS